jgi:E3 ubiquitin-protein ligase SHPRH
VYDESFERALDELGLDACGVAATDGWTVDPTLLRACVRRLRGITTHPQVGALVDRTERLLSKAGVLKSIGEVLEVRCIPFPYYSEGITHDGIQDMVNSNSRGVLENRKHRVELLTTQARLLQRDEKSHSRYQDALALMKQAEEEIGVLIADVRKDIEEHDRKGEELKASQAKLDGKDDDVGGKGKGKGKADAATQEEGQDEAITGIPKTPAGETHIHTRKALFARLRECLVLHHKVKFIQGDVLHILGLEEEEGAAYAAAERLRNVDILSCQSFSSFLLRLS